jgi:hypothetical protein
MGEREIEKSRENQRESKTANTDETMYRNPACDMNGAIEELSDGAVWLCVVCLWKTMSVFDTNQMCKRK